MSIEHNVYLGPYVECTYEKTLQSWPVFGCPSCQSVRAKSVLQFCGVCGTKHTNYTKDEYGASVDEIALIDEMEETLVTIGGDSAYQYMQDNDVHLYIPNTDEIGFTESVPFGFEGTYFQPDSIALQMNAFENLFSKELTLLRGAYVQVVVKWGLFCYSS